ncbi:MAG: PorT family protein [Bacteroidetes bacterium]|nr:MAG: PorT family protein [Bacteroidota bacterium]
MLLKRIIFFLSFFLLILLGKSENCHAQMDNVPINLPKYDKQKLHFGFTLGLNRSNFKVQLMPDFKYRDSIYRIEPVGVMGLNLGIISNLRLGEYFDLRFIPALSFAQRNLEYTFYYEDSTGAFITKNVESTYLEFPVNIKFKSKRVNN